MFIGLYERKILKIVYQFWKDREELASSLNKKNNAFKDITEYDIPEKLVNMGSMNFL